MSFRMLIMNLGGTSSKIAVYLDRECLWSTSIPHPVNEVKAFNRIVDQFAYRKEAISKEFLAHGEKWENLDAVCSRCGPVKPVASGTYRISKELLDDTVSGKYGSHPSSLGVMFAMSLSEELGIPAFTVDPPVSNGMIPEASYTGFPEIYRQASYQALNHHATALKYCKDHDVKYSDVNLIIAHMGSGITIASHRRGVVIDVNNGLDGDGPFALERAGKLPCGDLVTLCYSGQYTYEEMMKRINGKGGLIALLGEMNALSIEKRINEGDEHADEVIRAMALNVSKEIASNAAVLCGDVDAVVLTGGLAHWQRFVEYISQRVSFIAPISVYPGENEIDALAAGTFRALTGEEETKEYV